MIRTVNEKEWYRVGFTAHPLSITSIMILTPVGYLSTSTDAGVGCTDAETNRGPGIEHSEMTHAEVAPVSYGQKVPHVVPLIMGAVAARRQSRRRSTLENGSTSN